MWILAILCNKYINMIYIWYINIYKYLTKYNFSPKETTLNLLHKVLIFSQQKYIFNIKWIKYNNFFNSYF